MHIAKADGSVKVLLQLQWCFKQLEQLWVTSRQIWGLNIALDLRAELGWSEVRGAYLEDSQRCHPCPPRTTQSMAHLDAIF